MFRKLSLVLAVSLALPPMGVVALGLGDIETRSALNESFDADIGLVSVSPGEIDDVKVELATSGDFSRAGVDRPYFLSKLQFQPMVLDNGDAVIRVTSREPVREPYLNFLIEVNWPKGRLVREFTVLLDPPVTLERKPPVVAVPVVGNVPRVSRGVDAAAPVRVGAAGGDGLEYGPVRSGSTLWGIARELDIPGASTEQVVMALFRNNPDAFIHNDIDLLKAGAILRLPEQDEVFLLQPREARREFLEQARDRLAGEAMARREQVDELRIATTRLEEQEALAGDGTAPKARDIERVKTDLMMVRETSESTRQETEELRGRIRELEGQLGDIRKLLKLKSDQLAQLQSGQPEGPLPEEVAPPPEVSPEVESEPIVEPEPSVEPEPAIELEPPVESEPEAAPAPRPQVEKPVQPAAPVAKPSPPAQPEKQAPTPAPLAAPAPEPGLLDKFIASPLLQAIAAAVVVVVGLLAWLLIRRRQMEEDSFQESALLSPAQDSVAVPDIEQEEGVERSEQTEETSFISDFSPSDIDALQEETGEVDPAAEADVYIAYGRYQQAESLINQAIEKNPDRLDLKLKLLEIYFTTRNVAAFTQLAEELEAAEAEQQDPQLWQRVVSMGQELIPEHRLFADAAAASLDTQATTADLADVDLDLPDTESDAVPELDLDLDTDLSELSTEDALGGEALDIEDGSILEPPGFAEVEPEESIPAPTAEVEESELAIDLEDLKSLEDIDFGEMEEEEVEIPAPPTTDFDFQSAEREEPLSELEEEPSEINLDELDLGDIEGTGEETVQQPLAEMLKEPDRSEEVETKLDLARAYVEMGDGDGAKEILQEVLEEGSEKQKTEAQDLIEQIG